MYIWILIWRFFSVVNKHQHSSFLSPPWPASLVLGPRDSRCTALRRHTCIAAISFCLESICPWRCCFLYYERIFLHCDFFFLSHLRERVGRHRNCDRKGKRIALLATIACITCPSSDRETKRNRWARKRISKWFFLFCPPSPSFFSSSFFDLLTHYEMRSSLIYGIRAQKECTQGN